MNFKLIGKIILNKAPKDDELKNAIDDFIKTANETTLTKGAPESKGAVVSDWSITDDKLQVTITSGQYVRAHDALLRLKKSIGVELGKKFKLGTRTVVADEYFIEIPITIFY